MSSLFKTKYSYTTTSGNAKVEDVPSAEDEARKKAEQEEMRKRQRNKGRRSTISSPSYEDTAADVDKPTLLEANYGRFFRPRLARTKRQEKLKEVIKNREPSESRQPRKEDEDILFNFND